MTNGDGTLVRMMTGATTTNYTQDLAGGLSQVLAQNVGGTATRYTYGLDRLASTSGGIRTWEFHDRLGSVRLTANNNGLLQTVLRYDPWGQPISTSHPAPFGFTGELVDGNTNLNYHRARWYNPVFGSFLGHDPQGGKATHPYTFHYYQYGFSSPTRYKDPSGRRPDPDSGGESSATCGPNEIFNGQTCVPKQAPQPESPSTTPTRVPGTGPGESRKPTPTDTPNPPAEETPVSTPVSEVDIPPGCELRDVAIDTYFTTQKMVVCPNAASYDVIGLLGELLSFALDLSPLGVVKGCLEGITGYDFITGRKLEEWDRILGILPAVGETAKFGKIFLSDLKVVKYGIGGAEQVAAEKRLLLLGRQLECIANSFTEETLVMTDEGEKPIADIKIGDKVLAYNEKTAETGYYTVTNTMLHIDPAFLMVRIDDDFIKT